jgi:hypothetical protein
VQSAVAQLPAITFWVVPWAHYVIIVQKVKDLPTRRWYMEQTLANGWSRNILALQIDAQVHARHGPFGSRMKADRYVAGGVPVIQGNNILDTRTPAGDLVFVSDETADEREAECVSPAAHRPDRPDSPTVRALLPYA